MTKGQFSDLDKCFFLDLVDSRSFLYSNYESLFLTSCFTINGSIETSSDQKRFLEHVVFDRLKRRERETERERSSTTTETSNVAI
jgi:hypothetical protein